MILTRQDRREWSDTAFPGIQTCITWTGTEGDGGYFARFQAGAHFPRHAHEGWEQIFVLRGAIRFNDVEIRAGDVLQVPGSDQHEAHALEETLLFVAHRGGIEIME